jgi:hypothetical protein
MKKKKEEEKIEKKKEIRKEEGRDALKQEGRVTAVIMTMMNHKGESRGESSNAIMTYQNIRGYFD